MINLSLVNEFFYFRCSRQFTWRTSLKRHVSKCDGNTNLNPRSSIAESSTLKVQSGTPEMFLATEKVEYDNGSVVQMPLQASRELTLREAGTDVLQVRSKELCGTGTQFVVVHPSQSAARFTQPSVAHPNIITSNVHETITVDSANKIMFAPVISTEQSHELSGQHAESGSSQPSG